MLRNYFVYRRQIINFISVYHLHYGTLSNNYSDDSGTSFQCQIKFMKINK